MNPLFQMVNNKNLLSQFMQFRKNFNGDPQQAIQQMLNSRQITQAQYDQAVQAAKEFQKMLGL